MTGNHLPGTPSELADLDVSWLYRLVSANVFEFPKTSKYTKLFNNVGGEWKELYKSQSEADMALAHMLTNKLGSNLEDLDRAFHLSGLMRKKWNSKRGTSTYGRYTLLKALQNNKSLSVALSDDALALRFSQAHADDLRFVAAWGKWFMWDGCRWAEDTTLFVQEKVRDLCRTAAAKLNEKERNRLALRIESRHSVAAIESLARSDVRHAATVDQWDCDRWLLNTPGGTVDLRSGKLCKHQRMDYCTKITGCEPGGKCFEWTAFLDRVTDHNVELQNFLQRIAGYALTGITAEQALFFLYGTGRNGKSTFLEGIARVMGDYATTAPMGTFLDSSHEQHPTDLAGLRGSRLVTATETEAGRRWSESRLKSLTGGDRISARYMRQDFFSYTPTFKILIAGNNKPELRTVDEAMRRRFNLVPFLVTIPTEQCDLKLGEKLKAEAAGILQWAIDGCLAWQNQGLKPPPVVTNATEKYFDEEDVLGQWIAERCLTGKHLYEAVQKLHSDFNDWSGWPDSSKAWSKKRFSQALAAKGYLSEQKGNKKTTYSMGIALQEPHPQGVHVQGLLHPKGASESASYENAESIL